MRNNIDYRSEFRNFAEKKIAPIAAETDRLEQFPQSLIREIGNFGWMGIPFSQEFGGMALDYRILIQCVEEMSAACGSTGVIVSSHTTLSSEAVNLFGTNGQKQQYLTQMASGTAIGAFALTEHEAGSDISQISTTAKRDGDFYVLNGGKIFITNSGHADVYIVIAKTSSESGRKGLSAFIVEKALPRFSVKRIIPKMGIRGSSTGELSFSNCWVPAANMLGREGQGYEIALSVLDRGRIGIASQAVGLAAGAFRAALSYVKKREQFGKSLSAFQHIRFELAEMETKIAAARLLTERAAALLDQGISFRKEASMAKLFASETAMEVTTRALQLHGGYGYTRDLPLERMMRDAKITEIYEGTNEVQRMVIAANLLH